MDLLSRSTPELIITYCSVVVKLFNYYIYSLEPHNDFPKIFFEQKWCHSLKDTKYKRKKRNETNSSLKDANTFGIAMEKNSDFP